MLAVPQDGSVIADLVGAADAESVGARVEKPDGETSVRYTDIQSFRVSGVQGVSVGIEDGKRGLLRKGVRRDVNLQPVQVLPGVNGIDEVDVPPSGSLTVRVTT